MTKLLRASALVLALSASALADDGIMQNGSPAPPPPTTSEAQPSADQGTGGIIQTDLVETVVQVSTSVLQALA